MPIPKRPHRLHLPCCSLLLATAVAVTTCFLSVCSVEATTATSLSRLLLTNEDGQALKVTLRFSLWFPDYGEEDYEALSSSSDHPVRDGVLAAALDVICSEEDVLVRQPLLVDNNNNELGPDVCPTRLYMSGADQRQLDDEMLDPFGPSSILSSEPEVIVRMRATEELVYSTWIIRYPVLQIGDLYLQEALANNPDLPFSDLWDSSVNAMEQVSQLALEVSIMEGNFDTALRTVFDSVLEKSLRVYSSPLRKEDSFEDIMDSIYASNEYNPPAFSALRLVGLVSLLVTLSCMGALYFMAKRRRRAIIRSTRKVNVLHVPIPEKKEEGPLLVTPEGVEQMLEQSSTLRLPASNETSRIRSTSVSSRASRVSRASRTSRSSRASRAARSVHRSISRDSRRSKGHRSISRDSRQSHRTHVSSLRDNNSDDDSHSNSDDGSRSVGHVSISVANDGSVESIVPLALPSSAASYVGSVGIHSDDEGDIHGISMKRSMDSDDSDDIQAMIQLPNALKVAPGSSKK